MDCPPEDPKPVAQRKKRRAKDGVIVMFDGELVNRIALAELLHVPPLRISQWIKLPSGLPFIRVPSGNPSRRGLRMMFNVAVARQWLETYTETPNPRRKGANHGS